MIPLILSIPYYAGIEVVKASNSPTETAGYWRLTAFGKTIQLYALVVLFFESLIPTLLLVVLNIISLIRFKMMMNRVTPTALMRHVEIKLVRLVLILTFICIFTRMLDNLTEFFARGLFVLGTQLSSEMESLRILSRQTAIFFLFGAHALDSILCYFYDRHLKYVACQLIRKPYRKLYEFVNELCYNFI